MKAGTIFDNILVCDDAEFAKAEAEKNIIPLMAKEKEMKKTADDEESDKRRKDEVCFFFWVICDKFLILYILFYIAIRMPDCQILLYQRSC